MRTRFRPIIRVFVSSTFSDLKEERNALQRDVFPRLEHYCLVRGFQFQAIDLRWGIPGEARRDHRTMQICLDELQRAQEVSPRPNFLVLLGDRYGWQPLTETITEAEFQTLEKAAGELDGDAAREAQARDSATHTLRTWYRRDDNALPVEYQLRSRNDWPGMPQWTEEDEEQEWKIAEKTLWAVINRAYPQERMAGRFGQIPGADEPLPSIVKFQASATEQEIWRGALAVLDVPEHVVAWYRAIRNLNEYRFDPRAWDFFDRDDDLLVRAAALKSELSRRLYRHGRKGVQSVEVDLLPSADDSKLEVTCDHLEAMCDGIEVRLREVVDEEISAYWRPLAYNSATTRVDRGGPTEARNLKLEIQTHERFGESRAPKRGFVGRDHELGVIADYLSDETVRKPLVVCGPPGTGKTALLARAAQLAAGAERRVFVRFLGTTPQSSNLRSLLANLCRALRPAKRVEMEVPTKLHELQEEFDQLLAQATPEKPILLFLDALDQLDEADSARQTYWLRTPLPPHVKIVVSCIHDDEFDKNLNEPYLALEGRKLLDSAIAVESLTAKDAMRAIDLWLAQPKPGSRCTRRLTDEQYAVIASHISPETATACRRPLYLKILFAECRLWPSWKVVDPVELGENTTTLLAGLFKRLAQDAMHGPLLVESVLSYMASARRGLSENEILEVLWTDPDYKQHLEVVSRKNNHELPREATRIPIAIWSRVRHDLDRYLTEKSAPGGVVLAFYHREVGRVVMQSYLRDASRRCQRHSRLAEYFQGDRQQWWRAPRNDSPPLGPMAPKRLPNARKADELPQQRLWAVDTSKQSELKEENAYAQSAMESLFQCLAFLEAKAEAGMIFNLITDFDAAIKATPEIRPHRHTLVILHRALRRDASGIVLRPHLLLQFLWHTCYWHDSPLTAQYCEWNPSQNSQEPSLPWNQSGPKLFQLMERWLAESKQEGAVRLPWLRSRRPSGAPLASPLETILRGHTSEVLCIAVTSDGRHMVSGSSDTTVRLWEVESGVEKAVIRGHTAAVTGVAITLDGLRIVSASEDKTVRMWDTATCVQVGILRGSWRSEFWYGGGLLLDPLTFSEYFVPPEQTMSGRRHKGFTSVAITPDGRYIICGSEDDIQVWDPESSDRALTVLRPVRYVTSVAVKQDGQILVSNGTFNQVVLGEIQQVLVWDVRERRPVTVLNGDANPIDAVAGTPDGRCIVSGSRDGTVRLWPENGAAPLLFREHIKGVTSVAVTSNGHRIVSGSMDKTVRVWGYENGAELAVLRGHESGITCVAVAANGQAIFSGSTDKTVRLWSLETSGSVAAQYEYRTANTDDSDPNKTWAENVSATLPDGRRVRIHTGYVRVFDASTTNLHTVIPLDPRFDRASLTSDGRELELSAFDSETVIYRLDIPTARRRKMTLKHAIQRVLRRILGVSREDIPLIAPTATKTKSDWSEYVLQTALRWAFGVQADATPFNSATIPAAEFYWPGYTVILSESREHAAVISGEEVIPCTVEAGTEVFR